MKKLIAVAFVFLSFMTFAQGQKNFLDVNYIEVTGKTVKEVVPDMIYLNIVVSEQDSKRTNIEAMERKMMKTLFSIGVDVKKDFRVKDFSSNFQRYFLKKTDIKTTKEYELIVHSGAMAGNALVALEAIGVSNISIEKLRHSNIDEIKMKAKIDAVKNAKVKAKLMTKELGQSIGKALYVREQNEYIRYPFEDKYRGARPMLMRVSDVQNDSGAPEIEFKQIRIEYTVNIRFELL